MDGIGRYTRELLDRLLLTTEHEFFLYSDGPLPSEITRHRVRTRCFPQRSTLTSALAPLYFSRWMRKDAIQSFWSPRHHLPLSPGNARCVVSVHDLCWRIEPSTMPAARRWSERALFGRSVARADRLLCVSQATADALASYAPNQQSKIQLVYPGVAQSPLTASEAASPNSYFLAVGTIEPRKNYAALLAGYRRAQGQITSKLVIVGRQGWGGIDLSAIARSNGVSNQVEWRQAVSDEELAVLYRGATAVVTSALYEGFGLPLIEASAHGTRVIASDIPAHREVLGDSAELFRLDCLDSLVSALRRVETETSHQRLAKIAESQERCKRYSWETSVASLKTALVAGA